jgi:hypothetical protein
VDGRVLALACQAGVTPAFLPRFDPPLDRLGWSFVSERGRHDLLGRLHPTG